MKSLIKNNYYKKDYLIAIKETIALYSESSIVSARMFTYEVIKSYWHLTMDRLNCDWDLPKIDFESDIGIDFNKKAIELSEDLLHLSQNEAFYFIGILYTSMLPTDYRSKMGAYYTPPVLADRLIENITSTGFSWSNSTIVDPACGGAAFLVPVAQKVSGTLINIGKTPFQIIDHLSSHLTGYDLDYFSAWIAQVLTELVTIDIAIAANKRLPKITYRVDSLRLDYDKKYDLIIGNPPYGKVTLAPDLRSKFARSVYGHANLYGLFLDLAVNISKPNGLIAYVLSSSFLGGQYFKELRSLLAIKANPIIIDFIPERSGVFQDVLQETVLALFESNSVKKRTVINSLSTDENSGTIKLKKLGLFRLPLNESDPWLFPRSEQQKKILSNALKMGHRLKNYGYEVVTGQLVWNRCKSQLKNNLNNDVVPLIWAESVTQNGFEFSAARKNHTLYFEPLKNQEYLITKDECILIQRTTSKEQNRRIVSCILPKTFLNKHKKGVVVENHLNIVRPSLFKNTISLKQLFALLNSETVDQIFRCISGSVAVSAYELNSLPLPDPQDLKGIVPLIKKKNQHEIESYIRKLYGIE
jgi:adenine-specific DNA-methyltransferase